VICARKTARLVEELRRAEWKPCPRQTPTRSASSTTADGWSKPYRFVALRYEKTREELEEGEAEQYQLFETASTRTGLRDRHERSDSFVVWFYGQRGGAKT